MLVDDMLEGVNHRAVRDEGEALERVHVLVFLRVRAEELFHVRPGEELHAHRVGLRGLHAAAGQLQREAVVRDQEGVEGVAGLVRHDVHVAGGAVEVGEDEGLLVLGEFRAVAAAPFVLARVDVESLVLEHQVDEGAGLLAHRVVHLLRRGEDLLLAARLRIAAGGDDAVVVEVIVPDAETLRVFGAQARHGGHDVAQDVLAEGFDLLLVVAEAAHAVVAQLDEVDVAHLLRDAVAHLDEQVEDLVQFGLVCLEPAAEHLVALLAGGAVGVAGVFHQRGARHRLAAEGELHRAHQVGIAAHELVLLDHVLDHGLGHGFALHLHRPEEHRAERLLQLGAEGGIQQRRGVLDLIVAGAGADLVVVVVFGHVKLFHGVDRVAHAGQRRVG